MNLPPSSDFRIPISRRLREQLGPQEMDFTDLGSLILTDIHAAEQFAARLNRSGVMAEPINAGQLLALGVIDEALNRALLHYESNYFPNAFAAALSWLEGQLGQSTLNGVLSAYCEHFPPAAVFQGQLSIEAFLAADSGGIPNRRIMLHKVIVLWVMNQNPALRLLITLFDDSGLAEQTAYRQLIDSMHGFFEGAERRWSGLHLFDFLRQPERAAPHSLIDQLQYIQTWWQFGIDGLALVLLRAQDLLREAVIRFDLPGPGPGPPPVLEYADAGLDEEPEQFTPDRAWMPNLVLIAKHTYVWLDQLSRQYGRSIVTLDQIPDAELDQLAAWGITGLWLIGLWERSPASERIKHLTGNKDAVASAYSIFDYQIAGRLGGDPAYQDLRSRAAARGIRLAADMVPNHTGIYSRWIVDYPERFLAVAEPPYPSYRFEGADLSPDPAVGIFLEDHYYDRTDAAVVFKRLDRRSGRSDYIYHGNDGTALPWNDTAQLDYLNPETRQAVIDMILGVARRFQVIRFDAAMTLANKHYQRLWFPEPGQGGAIPTRAAHGLTRQEFENRSQGEFWREVVDRINEEAPDTLLLAEAFWLMEGYFVRTLGMHRVYNSAFMHMLRDEENEKYRQVIKNTLAFDPEILKRFVNFMNNPDEKTAREQFGIGDKYFGICTLMVTMPGLPMFGHGQVEGFGEKYGMEFARPLQEEHADQELVARHEREIFPLLTIRSRFSEVTNFALYDFVTTSGETDENVIAYSNGPPGQTATLVVYNNRAGDTRGRIRLASPLATDPADSGQVESRPDLAAALGLQDAAGEYLTFRDAQRGLNYIRRTGELRDEGLYLELSWYSYQVLSQFEPVPLSETDRFARLYEYLAGGGAPDLQAAWADMIYGPIRRAFRRLVEPSSRAAFQAWARGDPDAPDFIESIRPELERLVQGAGEVGADVQEGAEIRQEIEDRMQAVSRLAELVQFVQRFPSGKFRSAVEALKTALEQEASWHFLLIWNLVAPLDAAVDGADQPHFEWMRSWGLEEELVEAAGEIVSQAGTDFYQALNLVSRMGISQRGRAGRRAAATLDSWIAQDEIAGYLHRSRGPRSPGYQKKKFRRLVDCLFLKNSLELLDQPQDDLPKVLGSVHDVIDRLQRADETAGYSLPALRRGILD